MTNFTLNPTLIIAIILAAALIITLIRHFRSSRSKEAKNTNNTNVADITGNNATNVAYPPGGDKAVNDANAVNEVSGASTHTPYYDTSPFSSRSDPASSIPPEAAAMLAASVLEMEQNLSVLDSLTKMQEIAGMNSKFRQN